MFSLAEHTQPLNYSDYCVRRSHNLRHGRVKGPISSDISRGPSIATACGVQQTMQQHFLNSISCFCDACVETPLPLHSLHKSMPQGLSTHWVSTAVKTSQFILRPAGNYLSPLSQMGKPRQRAVNYSTNSVVSVPLEGEGRLAQADVRSPPSLF